MYYHIVTDLERRFSTLDSAVSAYTEHRIVPKVPKSKLEGENDLTPRLCVCDNIPDCLTAIGLQDRLKRCLSANDDGPTFATKFNEVYPVIVLEFPNFTKVYEPSEEDVPDVNLTSEKWILHEITPHRVTVKWLGPNSILFENRPDYPDEIRAISCEFVTNFETKDHPWLNGQGHILHSGALESDAEDYNHLPMGKYLGNIQTLKSTIQQISEIMAWKKIIGSHEIKIKSAILSNKYLEKPSWLEIVCKGGDGQPPELYLQLVQIDKFLAKSENFTSLEELQRTGVRYNNQTYRPRIWTINADSKTGKIPVDSSSTPCQVPPGTNIADFSISDPANLAELENDPNK